MELPKLYGIPSNGKKVKQWTIKVLKGNDNSVIERTHGYVGHKETITRKEITKGKNIGKKNETTTFEQASLEAQSLWKKQKQSGYTENLENTQEKSLILPMLAHDYNKRKKDIGSNIAIQPKIDGVRLVAHIDPVTDNIVFTSRTGKEMNNLEHIAQDLIDNEVFYDKKLHLDGELFTFDLPFEEISGIFRKKTLTPKVKLLKFHIFDSFSKYYVVAFV